MKPIFEQERNFLKMKGINIPENCWIDGKKIYLNADKNTLIIQFKVEHKQIIITKDKIAEVLKGYPNKTFEEEIKENRDRLEQLINKSVNMTVECINKYPNHQFRISDSGGKDSLVTKYIFERACAITNKYNYVMDIFNTTNDTADTYKTIKQSIRDTISFQYNLENKIDISKEELEDRFSRLMLEYIHNPKIGWHQWLKEVKNYYLPSVMVRNCCSTYKEGKLKEVLDKKGDYVLILGMRKYESVKRSNYDYYLNDSLINLYNKYKELYENEEDEYTKEEYRKKMNKNKINVPINWVRFLPIVELKDEDVWMIIMMKNLRFNPMYKKGFQRVGCLLCPYSSDYNDLLIEYYYPTYWDRWVKIVEKNYDLYNVANRLKWSKEEYTQEGKWKDTTSKEQDIITKKATPERIKELADLKGISEEMASKFFVKKCSCGRKLNPDEKAMFYKLFGRYEGKEDNRAVLCKDCVCKKFGWFKREYADKIKEFRESGCNLF